jgi:glycerophosphoryl diester phosphodiesterase
MRRLLPALLGAAILPFFFGCSRFEVHGHRGARGLRPENTLPAFDYAIGQKVDVIELDLGVSKDEKLVIYHDQRINPIICSGRPGVPLMQLTLVQLKEIDCGSYRNPRFDEQVVAPGTKIPTLDEFFEWIKAHPDPWARKVRFNIETKSEPSEPTLSPPPARFAELIIEVLRRHRVLGRSIVQSFDFRTLEEVRKLEPKIEIAALVELRPEGAPGSLVEMAKKLGARIVSPNHEWLTENDIKTLHGAGLRVIPWTANSEGSFVRLKQWGVDGIITDYPDRLRAFLKR